jgi:pyruvate kinase
MRRTKIVCTLGPSSNTPERVRQLMQAGMNVARLNFSHGSHDDHAALYQVVRDAAGSLNRNVAILMDLQGPKIRTGPLAGGNAVMLEEGAPFTLTTDPVEGDAARVSTTYPALPRDVRAGDRIMLADGVMELQVEAVENADVRCRVERGGLLAEHKGINLPGVAVSAPSLTEKDRDDLRFGLDLGVDYVALSFVRHADDLRELKALVREAGYDTPVVAKIERPEALDHIDEILEEVDVIMVARGDLGVEVPLDRVPQIQKRLIRRCNERGIPVITATQMLESMTTHPRPTRAEVNDVANAIYDGTDAVMLSGETAAGEYPVRAVEVMAAVAERADLALSDGPSRAIVERGSDPEAAFSDAVARAACESSRELNARRIVCFTSSGYTAARIARHRPPVPIFAFTLTDASMRRCALYWGVEAVRTIEEYDIEALLRRVDALLIDHRLAEPGEAVVVVAGTPLAVAGRTNLLKLHRAGEEEAPPPKAP